jgi:hypothetical protein
MSPDIGSDGGRDRDRTSRPSLDQNDLIFLPKAQAIG